MDDSQARKRARCRVRRIATLHRISEVWRTLHESVVTPGGDPINVVLLKFLGQQAIAACCKAALHWASVGGSRVASCVDDNAAPYAPLTRLSPAFVQTIRFGREGRSDVLEHGALVRACCNVTLMFCNYSRLGGLGDSLQGAVLNLRWVRFRQCSLRPKDIAVLLTSAPKLEAAVFLNDTLQGICSVLTVPPTMGAKLRAIDFTECRLTAADAEAVFRSFPHLQYVHLQSMCLTGLCAPPACPALESLSVTDCQLSRMDALGLVAQCPNLRALNLCGNDLGSRETSATEENTWVAMPRLRVGDFRYCELTEADQATLRRSVPSDCTLVLRASLDDTATEVDANMSAEAASRAEAFGLLPLCGARAPSRRHVMFDDSSDSTSE